MVTRDVAADISVAIATRDRPEALARLLETLEQGRVRPREIVVADQSRDARTESVVRDHDSRSVVRYVRDRRAGLGIAQNVAFSHSRCRVIAVTDDDCVPEPDWLALVEARFATYPDLGALTGAVIPLEAEDRDLVPVSSRTSATPRTFSGKDVPWHVGSGNNFAVRREWLDRIGGNDERLGPGAPGQGGVDMDLFYRLLRAGAVIRYDPACLVRHERTTREGRLARRFPYGYGVGADVSLWLREGDRFALSVLGRWLALRGRRLLRGARAGDWTLAYEEALVLSGTARGLVYGLRAGRERPTSYALEPRA